MKKFLNKSKDKKGFTMVELIVVIVIILVLAAVLVPSLLKYVDKASEASCKNDAATILSQLQADYAASQVEDKTNVTMPTEISGVPVAEGAAGNIVAATPAISKPTTITSASEKYAVYTVADHEINAFGYTDGERTAVWTLAGGWNVK